MIIKLMTFLDARIVQLSKHTSHPLRHENSFGAESIFYDEPSWEFWDSHAFARPARTRPLRPQPRLPFRNGCPSKALEDSENR